MWVITKGVTPSYALSASLPARQLFSWAILPPRSVLRHCTLTYLSNSSSPPLTQFARHNAFSPVRWGREMADCSSSQLLYNPLSGGY